MPTCSSVDMGSRHHSPTATADLRLAPASTSVPGSPVGPTSRATRVAAVRGSSLVSSFLAVGLLENVHMRRYL